VSAEAAVGITPVVSGPPEALGGDDEEEVGGADNARGAEEEDSGVEGEPAGEGVEVGTESVDLVSGAASIFCRVSENKKRAETVGRRGVNEEEKEGARGGGAEEE
jgi:hypothetical protein